MAAVSSKCIIVQPVEKKVVNSHRTFVIDLAQEFKQLEVVDSLNTWMVLEIINVPPSVSKAQLGGVHHPDTRGCFFKQKPGTRGLTLPEFAATRAFHNLNVQQMQWFAKLICVRPRERTLGETAWARVLMQYYYPEWTSEKLDETIREWRGERKRKQAVEVCVFLSKSCECHCARTATHALD